MQIRMYCLLYNVLPIVQCDLFYHGRCHHWLSSKENLVQCMARENGGRRAGVGCWLLGQSPAFEALQVASGKATVVVRCTCILGCCMSSHNMYMHMTHMTFLHKGTHALMHNIAQLRSSISLYHEIKLYRCQDMGMVRFPDTLSNLHVMVYQYLAYNTQKYMTLHPKHCTLFIPFLHRHIRHLPQCR